MISEIRYTKIQATKENIAKLGFLKIKKLLYLKGYLQESEKTIHLIGEISLNYISDKGLVPGIYSIIAQL